MKVVTDSDVLEHLSKIHLFDDLNPKELAEVAIYLHIANFVEGETIFSEGDPGKFACFLLSGRLDVVKKAADKQVVIATLGRGRAIGEMAVLDDSSRSASAVASRSGRVILLYKERFEELLDKNPRIGVHLLLRIARMMSLNLRKISADFVELLPD